MNRFTFTAVALAWALCLGGCGGGSSSGGSAPDPAAVARVLRVPSASFASIQSAVDAARPGDLVLIAPGVYHESVKVPASKPRIVLRGVDRASVVLDGTGQASPNGIAVNASGVAVENMTLRGWAVNGLVFAPVGNYGQGSSALSGWRGSYITALDNGLYGVYAFQAVHGQFDHIYAAGHPDSGIYVGQCRPCAAVVRDSEVVGNSVGYEETNATGVTTTGLFAHDNRLGVLLNGNLKEKLPPQGKAMFVGNRVVSNTNRAAPTANQGFGSGIVISGGVENVIQHNLITGHSRGAGVVVINAAQRNGGYQATNNTITSNTLSGNGTDLVLDTGTATQGNCFSANKGSTSVPARLEQVTTCGRSDAVRPGDVRLPSNPSASGKRGRSVATPQPGMPDAATAPARPAVGLPPVIDTKSIGTPSP